MGVGEEVLGADPLGGFEEFEGGEVEGLEEGEVGVIGAVDGVEEVEVFAGAAAEEADFEGGAEVLGFLVIEEIGGELLGLEDHGGGGVEPGGGEGVVFGDLSEGGLEIEREGEGVEGVVVGGEEGDDVELVVCFGDAEGEFLAIVLIEELAEVVEGIHWGEVISKRGVLKRRIFLHVKELFI